MIKLPLNKRKFAYIDDNFMHLNEYKWYFNSVGYACRSFRKDNGLQGMALLHHCVIGFPLNGLEVDHIDGNKLNNQKDNLRIVTRRQNLSNRKERREGKTTSKFIGVSWHNSANKWRAMIHINGNKKHLGLFVNEKDASDAYQLALSHV